MKTYTCHWASVLSGGNDGKLEKLVADGFIDDHPLKPRWFQTEAGERIEIPVADVSFWFSKERLELIQEQSKKSPSAV